MNRHLQTLYSALSTELYCTDQKLNVHPFEQSASNVTMALHELISELRGPCFLLLCTVQSSCSRKRL